MCILGLYPHTIRSLPKSFFCSWRWCPLFVRTDALSRFYLVTLAKRPERRFRCDPAAPSKSLPLTAPMRDHSLRERTFPWENRAEDSREPTFGQNTRLSSPSLFFPDPKPTLVTQRQSSSPQRPPFISQRQTPRAARTNKPHAAL